LLYSVILTVAAICGVMDIVLFWNVRETPEHIQQMAGRRRRTAKSVARTLRHRPVPENAGRVWRGLRRETVEIVASLQQPLRERQVRNYLLFAGTGVMGFASQGALLWLLCLENFDWPKTQTGFVLTVAPMVGMALTSPFWGRMVKEHGTRPIARSVSILLIFIPVAWLSATAESWWTMLFIVFLSGIFAVAYDICNLTFITRAAPHLPRPTLTALFGITTGTVAGVTSWLAGFLAQQLQGFHLELLGHEFVNYHILFAFSLLVRILNAFVFAPRLEEPDATPTRDAVREVATSLYLGLVSRLTSPFGARN
jgi:MFS family permease